MLVAKVDCTVHKDLCQTHGVQGYPTLKYSNGYGWSNYEGERKLEGLLKFAEENLQDGCLDDKNLCSEEEAKELEDYEALTTEDIEHQLEENKAEREKAETLFKEHVQQLQKQYDVLQEEKTTRLKDLSRIEALLRYAARTADEDGGENIEL